MKKSLESIELEKYAASLEGSYDHFVLAMGILPQRKGVDKELLDYVEKNNPDYDALMLEYVRLSGLYRG